MAIPTWAIPMTAAKLVYQSLRHPNTDKEIIIDPDVHKVKVVSTSSPDQDAVEKNAAS